MKRPARRAFWSIYIGVFLVLAFLAILTESDVFGFIMAVWFWLGWLPARLLVPLVVSSIRCWHCGEQYECVSRWKCACGYADHQDRHILRFRCPLCQARLGWINCLRCHATILIR